MADIENIATHLLGNSPTITFQLQQSIVEEFLLRFIHIADDNLNNIDRIADKSLLIHLEGQRLHWRSQRATFKFLLNQNHERKS